jgi:hypothetical protein
MSAVLPKRWEVLPSSPRRRAASERVLEAHAASQSCGRARSGRRDEQRTPPAASNRASALRRAQPRRRSHSCTLVARSWLRAADGGRGACEPGAGRAGTAGAPSSWRGRGSLRGAAASDRTRHTAAPCGASGCSALIYRIDTRRVRRRRRGEAEQLPRRRWCSPMGDRPVRSRALASSQPVSTTSNAHLMRTIFCTGHGARAAGRER